MGRIDARAGPHRRRGPALKDSQPRQATEPVFTVAPAVDLSAWRDRDSWLAAAAHLNAAGLAAAVPADLVPYLRRRGLAVWPRSDRRAA